MSCDWKTYAGNYDDLTDYFFETKIKTNGLNLSVDIFQYFKDCFTHQIVIEFFKFFSNNKKYIKNEDIKIINKYLKNEYIPAGKNIDFKNHTYHSLKRLADEWHITEMLKDRFADCYDQKIVQEYFLFICKNMKRVRDEDEIRDVCDFLNARINNEQDFNFENRTWRELKQLSDAWHLQVRFPRNQSSRWYLTARWKNLL